MKQKKTESIRYKYELLLDEKTIKQRIKVLARQIDHDYKGTVPIFLSILHGAFIFTADLFRSLSIDCEVEFLRVSSYGNETKTTGKIKLITPIPRIITDRNILIVEDIIDSGNTVKFLKKELKKYNPRSLKIISLLYKNENAPKDVKVDYIGFEIPNHFVVGYGLDFMQQKRNLKNIYRLVEEQ